MSLAVGHSNHGRNVRGSVNGRVIYLAFVSNEVNEF
jgi:hypothetical protein